MEAGQVVALMSAFDERGLHAWVAGGWAVDAVFGRQTRDHGDLDLAVDGGQLRDILALLASIGFTTTVDWLPVRAELTAQDGRVVDLHPVAFAPDGSGVQPGLDGVAFAYSADGFTEGVIDGHRVAVRIGVAAVADSRGLQAPRHRPPRCGAASTVGRGLSGASASRPDPCQIPADPRQIRSFDLESEPQG